MNKEDIETEILNTFLKSLSVRLGKTFEIESRPDKTDRKNPQPDAIATLGVRMAIELTEIESYKGHRELEAGYQEFFNTRHVELRKLAEEKKVSITLPFELFRSVKKKDIPKINNFEAYILSECKKILADKLFRSKKEFLVSGTNCKVSIETDLNGVGGVGFLSDKKRLTKEHAENLKNTIESNAKKFKNYSDCQRVLVLHSADVNRHDICEMRKAFTRLRLNPDVRALEAYDQIWYMRLDNSNCSALVHLKAPTEFKQNKFPDIDDLPEMDEYLAEVVRCEDADLPCPGWDEWFYQQKHAKN